MTEYKRIVEEQAEKNTEENNNNALISFWLAERVRWKSARVVRFKNYKDRSEYEFSDKRKKAITEWK
jgi:hypothetical protein